MIHSILKYRQNSIKMTNATAILIRKSSCISKVEVFSSMQSFYTSSMMTLRNVLNKYERDKNIIYKKHDI